VKFGLFPMLLLSIVGDDLFSVVLGPEWIEAGVYSQILAIWMFFWFISSPLSTLFRVLEKQEFSLKINVIIFLSRLITLVIGGVLGDARIALILFSVSGILLYGYLCFSILRSAGVHSIEIRKIVFSKIILFLPAGCLLLGVKMMSTPRWLVVVIAFIALGVYGIYLFRSETWTHGYFYSIINKTFPFLRFKNPK